jgi:uncharacterized membrane protein YbhN (UPF0104 family)
MDLTLWIRFGMLIVAIASFSGIIFWMWVNNRMKRGTTFKGKILNWVYSRKFFYVFKHSRIADYRRAALYRLPIHLAIITSMYLLIRIFGANVSYADVLGKIPLVHLVSTIPIVPGGLGSIQFALVELLKNDITHPMIAAGTVGGGDILLAAVLLWLFVNAIMKVIVGTYYFQKSPYELFKRPNSSHSASFLTRRSQTQTP